jgi:hypothetical protein
MISDIRFRIYYSGVGGILISMTKLDINRQGPINRALSV